MKHQTASLVKKARELRGLKQSTLANKLGVNVNTVAGWEQGRHSVHPEEIARIAEILNLAIEYVPDDVGTWGWRIHPLESTPCYANKELVGVAIRGSK